VNEFERIPIPGAEVRRRPAQPTPAPVVARTAEGVATPMTNDSILHLQRTAGNATVSGMLAEESEGSPVKDFLAGSSGQSLDGPMRSNMEGALGADLSDVRIHRGGEASSSAASVQARAYTVGSDVVLGNDVNPASSEGQKTIAHELTHVVQQRSGPVDGSPAAGGIRLSDPSDRFERAAEATASAVMSGGTAGPAPAGGGGGATAQREAAPGQEEETEEPTAQGEFLQREAAPGQEDETEEPTAQGEFLQRQTTATDEETDEDKANP
jgi:hypothetical protein